MNLLIGVIIYLFVIPREVAGSNVMMKQWSVHGKLAFLGAMRDECLKDENECEDGFTVGMWIKTTISEMQHIGVQGGTDSKYIASYLLSNGGQSSYSNGFYVRRMLADDEYEIGVAHRDNLWQLPVYLKQGKIVHFVFTWIAREGLAVYIDGLFVGNQSDPLKREYFGNNKTSDPNPHLVTNGDSLLFKQFFDEKTFQPTVDMRGAGHVFNVTYYHEWKDVDQIGDMTREYDDRLVAGCFFEIPFGGELVSMLGGDFLRGDSVKPFHQIYFKCRNDCVSKKSPNEPWINWLAIVDPRTRNCYCMLADSDVSSGHNLDSKSCQQTHKQTKAQFTSVAVKRPPKQKSVDVLGKTNFLLVQPMAYFTVTVPSMKCFFVITGQFNAYEQAVGACERRSATLAKLKTDGDLFFVQTQLVWEPLTGSKWSQRLLWVESGDQNEISTCNSCVNSDEACSFITNSHKERCDCLCAGSINDTTSVNSTVGVLCEKTVYDTATSGNSFCGVPAVASNAINAFAMVGEVTKTFFVVSETTGWEDAVSSCENAKPAGNLASIRSNEENKAVQRELQDMWRIRGDRGKIRPLWIGARRVGPHRSEFVWTDNSQVIYTGWSVGEPNDGLDNNAPLMRKGEECVGLWPNWSEDSQIARGWNDFGCSNNNNQTAHFGALCEVY